MGDEKVPAGTTFFVNAGRAAAPEWRAFGTVADDKESDKESDET